MTGGNGKKIGRNDPCPCGSGQKHKYCCMSGARKKRLIPTGRKCECCGHPLVADLTDDLMNIFSGRFDALKHFCRDNGIYLFGIALSIQNCLDMIELLRKNELTVQRIMQYYKSGMPKETSRRYAEQAADLHPAFAKRARIIHDAIEAHYNGIYSLSIAALFAQIEGILRDIGGLACKDSFRSTIPLEIWNRRLLFDMEDDAKSFNAFISNLYKGQPEADEFNRNAVLHGMSADYASEEKSLMLLMCVFEIRNFVWFQKNTNEILK